MFLVIGDRTAIKCIQSISRLSEIAIAHIFIKMRSPNYTSLT
ncbi:MAG: hypothetical protein ACK5XC_15960 [Pseudanabaena sp.]